MAQAKPRHDHARDISFDPEDIGNPANAQYLYEGPDGTKFIDWSNPGPKLERWVERINVLLSGDAEKIEEYYRDEYYRRLVSRQKLEPDYEQGTEIA